jgi:predicted RNA-binding Zn ribbon-like protein
MFHEFEFYGGALCLDFTNTVDSRRLAEQEEHLHAYPDLASWLRQSGAIDAAAEARLVAAARARPDGGRAVLAEAIGLREAVFRVFRAVGEGRPAPGVDAATIQAAYAGAMTAARLTEDAGRFGWTWPADALDLPAWLVARSAVDLGTAGPVDRIKVCASDGGCDALFLDTSKNRSRRWCTMAGCGSEVKIKRQAARRRAAARAAG